MDLGFLNDNFRGALFVFHLMGGQVYIPGQEGGIEGIYQGIYGVDSQSILAIIPPCANSMTDFKKNAGCQQQTPHA